MDNPSWNDVYVPEELASALEFHAAQMEHRHQASEVAQELRYAAACIRDLESKRVEALWEQGTEP